MKIHQMIVKYDGSGTIYSAAVMTEGEGNDIACYHVHVQTTCPEASYIAQAGHKMTAYRASAYGFQVPEGKFYRR